MKKINIILIILILAGCTKLKISLVKKSKPSIKEITISEKANTYFWNQFHQGNYDSLSKVINFLSISLSKNPTDFKTIFHLGTSHAWKMSERARLEKNITPDIVEQIFLAKKYFSEAHELLPDDPRVMGFLAAFQSAEARRFNNKKLQMEGYLNGLKSIHQWKELNKFTLGYGFSQFDTASKLFHQGLNWQWETIDDCTCKKYSKDKMDINFTEVADRIKKSIDPKTKRACWNSWIAPHNWEGFAMNFGDMLVKSGDWERAIEVYNSAKLSDSYLEWPYKNILEERISNVKENVVIFNNKNILAGQPVLMINSKFACTSCHQMSKKEFENVGHQELTLDYYFLKKK